MDPYAENEAQIRHMWDLLHDANARVAQHIARPICKLSVSCADRTTCRWVVLCAGSVATLAFAPWRRSHMCRICASFSAYESMSPTHRFIFNQETLILLYAAKVEMERQRTLQQAPGEGLEQWRSVVQPWRPFAFLGRGFDSRHLFGLCRLPNAARNGARAQGGPNRQSAGPGERSGKVSLQ